MFYDNTRDAIKGHCFYAREAGYVNGRPDMFPEIRAAVTAWCCSDALPEHAPGQIVSYVSAHDNYTLWDKLLLVRTNHPDYNVFDPAVLAENRLAAGPERAAWKALCVFYDPLAETRVVSLPEGRWKLLSDGTSSTLWQGESTVCTGEFSLPSCSAVIFGLL